MTPILIVSEVARPSPTEIRAFLEERWRLFHELFGIKPAPVKVVLAPAAGSASGGSRADYGLASSQPSAPGDPRHVIAWPIAEGEDLHGQGVSDLSHEIAHFYFLDLMGNPDGFHQPHAWLHEAVACLHEGQPFLANRRQWIRDHLGEHVPFEQFFRMKNPVKANPLVELTAQLHEQLVKGEMTVTDMNQRISDFAARHATELAQAGPRQMTYYSQALSVLQFLLEREGVPFLRRLVERLKAGAEMKEMLNERSGFDNGIPSLEAAWVQWVETGGAAS